MEAVQIFIFLFSFASPPTMSGAYFIIYFLFITRCYQKEKIKAPRPSPGRTLQEAVRRKAWLIVRATIKKVCAIKNSAKFSFFCLFTLPSHVLSQSEAWKIAQFESTTTCLAAQHSSRCWLAIFHCAGWKVSNWNAILKKVWSAPANNEKYFMNLNEISSFNTWLLFNRKNS